MTQSAGTAVEQPGPGLIGVTPHREFLEDRMDPDFGLLDKLLKCSALTRRDLSRVKARNTFQERNAELLDHIAKQHKCKELIAALEDTRQGHLVKYLKENGKYSPDFDGNWPLTKAELSIFDTNQESLVDLIETEDLMFKLLANGIINSRQKDFIATRSTPYEKNEGLIEILRRRSLRDYRTTIQCLHDTNQSHVAEIFESGGVVVTVHANLSVDDVTDVVQAEEEIASKIVALLQTQTEEESERILGDIMKLVGAKLISGKVGRSVVLYFLCQRDSGLRRLHQLWTSGRLTQITEALFNRLLLGRDRFKVTVRWTDSDCRQSKAFFYDRSLTDEKSYASDTKIYELPLELHDMILKNVCLLQMTTTNDQRNLIRDKDLFTSLASVEFCWFQRLKRRRFKSTLLRQITVLSRKMDKRQTIVRNNRDYLSEIIQQKDLIVLLRRSDCLTDQQTRSIRRHHQTRTMNEELLDFLRKLDSHEHQTVIEYLRRKKQRLAAHVFGEGGISVKVSLLSEKMANIRLAEQELATIFSELRDKKRPMPRPIEKLLIKMKSNDIEFLNISNDRGVNIWVLCKSSNGLQNLKDALETMRFLDDVTELFRQISLSDEGIRGTVRPSTVVMETSQFSKEVVVSTPDVGILQVPGRVHGVTKLNSLIYVLARLPNAVYVFSDQHPFKEIMPEIKLKTALKFEGCDICACSVSSCLYVSDSCGRVFKIPVDDKNEMTCWLKDGLRPPCTLSVCQLTGGVIIMASSKEPIGIDLYDSKAMKIYSVRLTESAITPRHVVSTSRESFVVIHKWKESGAWGLSEVNRKGETIRCFKGHEETSKSLGNPLHLALDEDGCVLVLDQMKKQVIRFDGDLNWQDVLLSKDELVEPLRLCYDAETRQLIVGQENGSVVIYHV